MKSLVGLCFYDLNDEQKGDFFHDDEIDYCGYCGEIWSRHYINYDAQGFSREACPKCIIKYREGEKNELHD